MRIFLCISLILVTLARLVSFSSDTIAYNWFFCKCSDNQRPPIGQGLDFVNDYDLYYLGKDEKVIYLTFDFGYENGNVEKIVETLEKHNAKASFFILENSIMRSPELVKRMAQNGYDICNHTMKHPDMAKITDEKLFSAQLTDLEKMYYDLTGREMTKCFRPPQGRFSCRCLEYAQKLGYKTIMWSFAYADWDNNKQPNEENAYQNIISHTHNGMVLLLHPTSKTNADIMDRLLCTWESEGYSFGLVSEL